MPTNSGWTAEAKALRRRSSARFSMGPGGLTPRSDWTFLLGGPPPDAPVPATETEAMGLPPFGRGVALLANAVADTDWFAQRWDSERGVFQRIPDQPAVVLEPDPTTTVWNYRYAAASDGILYGNHFAFLGYGDDASNPWPMFVVPVPADEVWLLIDPDNGSYWFTINGQTYPPSDLLHVSFGQRSGWPLGQGLLAQYATWLGGAAAAEYHAGSYFAGGALPPAVLQSPQVLTQDQGDELKAAWRAVANTREPVVLPMGYVLTPLVSNAEQNQLVQSRQWNAEAIAMMLGIPSYKLGLPGTTMTYQNVETADIDFIRDSVSRYASPLAAAFTKWCVPRGTVVRFDYSGRMRADQTTTATVLRTYTDAGILSVDEARAVIGRPPLELATGEGTTPEAVPELTPSEVA